MLLINTKKVMMQVSARPVDPQLLARLIVSAARAAHLLTDQKTSHIWFSIQRLACATRS